MRYAPIYVKGAYQGKRLDFMMSRLDGFKVACAGGSENEYILKVQREFFKRFPVSMPVDEEPTDEELEAVDDETPDDDISPPSEENVSKEEYEAALAAYDELCATVNFRKGQIERWLKYRLRKSAPVAAELEKASPKDPMTLWTGQLLGLDLLKKPQKPVAYNLWVQRDPKAKIKEDTVLAQQQKKNPSQSSKSQSSKSGDKIPLNIRLKVRRELFEKLPKDEQKKWEQSAKEENERAMKEYQEALTIKPSMDPEEIQNCIDNLPRLIQPILDLVFDWTGWHSTVILGGPEPADRGRLNVVAMHGGRTPGPVAMNFGQSFKTQYKEIMVPLFGNYLKTCFTPEKCKSVALTGFETQQYRCLREMNGEDDEEGSMNFGVIDFGPSLAEKWEALRQERSSQSGTSSAATSTHLVRPTATHSSSQNLLRSEPSQSSEPTSVPLLPPGLPLPQLRANASPPAPNSPSTQSPATSVPLLPPGLPLPPLQTNASAPAPNSPPTQSGIPPTTIGSFNVGSTSTNTNGGVHPSGSGRSPSPSFWGGDDMFAPQSPLHSPPRKLSPQLVGSDSPRSSASRTSSHSPTRSTPPPGFTTPAANATAPTPAITQTQPSFPPPSTADEAEGGSSMESPAVGIDAASRASSDSSTPQDTSRPSVKRRTKAEAMLPRKKLKETPSASASSTQAAPSPAPSKTATRRKPSQRIPPTRPSEMPFEPSLSSANLPISSLLTAPVPSSSSSRSGPSTQLVTSTTPSTSDLSRFAILASTFTTPSASETNPQLKRKRSGIASDTASSTTTPSDRPKRPRPRPIPAPNAASASTSTSTTAPTGISSSRSARVRQPIPYEDLSDDLEVLPGLQLQPLEGSRQIFNTGDLGKKWMDAVAIFQQFERLHADDGLPAKAGLGKGRKVAARPACIGAWIGRARRLNYEPDSDGIDELRSKFPAWWQSLQPEGRTVGTVTVGSGDWSALRVATENGFLNVMAGLLFWGNGVKASKENFAEWEKMLNDVIWVLRRMIATVPSKT